MPTIRFSFTDWRFARSTWPRHRPLLAETRLGPIRLVRVLSHRDSQRLVERECARAFADQQRREGR